jgi:ABC-2 type transport system ATP-binding protein
MLAVDVKGLVKDYGHFHAVKGISFDVKEGEVFGLIGPNGAGKTTTLRVLSTLLEISGGEVKIFGLDLKDQAPEVRKVISYLPEDAGAYKNMTGIDYLEFMAGFFAPEKDPKEIVARGIEIVHLGERIEDKVETYSKGMARRLLVGRALMVNPKLAILDEITSGLDVVNAQAIRKVVRQKTKEGTTVLLSSHNMLEVELMCDRIALVNDGRIVESGTPKELKEKYNASNIEEVFVEVVK